VFARFSEKIQTTGKLGIALASKRYAELMQQITAIIKTNNGNKLTLKNESLRTS